MKIKCAFGLFAINTPLEFVVRSTAKLGFFEIDLLKNDLFCTVIQALNDWIEEEGAVILIEKKTGIEQEEIRASIKQLIDVGVIVTELDNKYKLIDAKKDTWINSGWEEALLYHLYSSNLKAMDYAQDPKGLKDMQTMREFIQEEAPPDNFKVYEAVPFISLPDGPNILERNTLNLTSIFSANVAESNISAPFSLSELAYFLKLGFGQTAVKKLPVTGSHVAKTSPSGGSRHPTEAYVFLSNCKEIETGLYHYCVKRHGLALLKSGAFADFLKTELLGNARRLTFEPNLYIIYTTIYERSMFRYRQGRSYRVMHYDLGHLLQNTAYLASALGRSSYRGYSMAENEIEKFIGIDGFFEAASGYAFIG